MQVIIAEKPSVARELAAIVGAKNRKEGYIKGNGYVVTWAFGHLVQLAMPQQYGIEGFKAENLPILPPKFILLPRQIREGKEYKSDPSVLKQLSVIKELFNMADRIVVATDAGREGELIFRYIYSFLECRKPFVRLWINSLTDKAIREGLQNLRPGEEYDNLYLSAKARSEADWVVGINASQALSIAAGRGVWSLGRVQTPTLAIICSRYLENKDFEPATYFQLKLATSKGATLFTALSVQRFDDKEAAQAAYAAVMDADEVRVITVEHKEVKEQPPLLYDLTTLQKDANTRYGFSADKTLGIAQTLYEKKHITYPRTGSRYIPEDVATEIRTLLVSLREHPQFGREATAVSGSETSRRSIDNDKVTDHHALLITEVMPTSLSPEEQTIYDLIAGRMVEAFGGVCIKNVSTARLECGGMEFVAKGTIVREGGWRKVWREPEERMDDTTAALPVLQDGNGLPVKGCDVERKQTKPRPIHTESSLLAAMETAGRELTDEAEREAMKDSGIGTPATRAAIIETLFARDYIRREKKLLIPTDKGLYVYGIVKDKKIADVAMTGGWELALAKITTGEMDAFTFHRGIEVYAAQIAKELLEVKEESSQRRGETVCPRCGKQVVFYPKVAKCQNADCELAIWRTVARKELTDVQLSDLLTKGKTSVIKGFAKSSGETFDAAVMLDKEYKTVFDFTPHNKLKTGKGNKRK